MTEWLLLLVVGSAVAAAIGWPRLARSSKASVEIARQDDADAVRHRLALEALRDVEADYRAGSLDLASYSAQRAEAEAHAAATLHALEGAATPQAAAPAGGATPGHRRPLALAATTIAAALVVGFALPQPLGLGERTSINQPLADAIASEEARQAEIQSMLERIAADPRDAEALSALADAYLAGGSAEDRQRGAVALLALIGLQPENASAYRRLITAYMNAGDWTDARSALDAYAGFAGPDRADIPFFRGLLALRGDGDADEALRQFDLFLELAPDDPRAPMIRSLRAEAAGQVQ
jgi:cytochrome c-type biogenesis protein CcmH/NrfG